MDNSKQKKIPDNVKTAFLVKDMPKTEIPKGLPDVEKAKKVISKEKFPKIPVYVDDIILY